VVDVVEELERAVNHPDYQGDAPRRRRGEKLSITARSSSSTDIYHMQIMEGDLIKTIRISTTSSPLSQQAACPAATSSTARRK